MDYPKMVGGFLVVIFASVGMVAFDPVIIGSDRCQNLGEYGTWENVTERVYYDSDFSGVGRYYCAVEAEVSPEDCLALNSLINAPGCKWGARASSTKKTLYVIEDPIIEASIADLVRTEQDCLTEYWNETYSVVDVCKNVTDKTNGTTYESCTYQDEIIERNKTICKDVALKITLSASYNKTLDYSEFGYCSKKITGMNSFQVICDSALDSNMDGVCTSGESCCVYNCTNEGCDFGNGDCDVNQYIERQQKKYDRLNLKVTDSISKVEVMVR